MKIRALILSAAVGASLVIPACGGDDTTATGSTGESESSTTGVTTEDSTDGDSTESTSSESTGTETDGEVCELDCGNNGECIEDPSGDFCECDLGYAGDLCDECDTGFHDDGEGNCVEDMQCYSTTCSFHGDCSDDTGRTACACHSGYVGDACAECDRGFHLDDEQLCDANEACADWDGCGPNGTCEDADDLRQCLCGWGWTGEFCNGCAPGFTDNGDGACSPIFECTSTACNNHGACSGGWGDVSCECDPGYAGDWCESCADGFHLVDGSCSPDLFCDNFDPCNNGTCNDTGGDITCDCDPNWAGDFCQLCAAGTHLEGEECVEDTLCFSGTCSGAGTCDDSGIELVCLCDEGYTGQNCESCAGAYHRDVFDACVPDESCTDGDPCGSNGTCTDHQGTVACACFLGYAGSDCESCAAGYHDENGQCVVDEVCEELSCNQHGDCSIPNGVIECACFEGYVGDTCDTCDTGFSDDGSGNCVSVCGDGVVAGSEACDDGDANSDSTPDACRSDCTLPSCGDAVQDTNEACDVPGDSEDCTYGLTECQYCDAACALQAGNTSFCGDTVTDGSNGEDCDDGNAVTEACSYGETSCSVCTATCVTGPGVTSFCGDGQVDGSNGEVCDDGNSNSDSAPDACRSDCTPPSCGDGVTDSGEQCDDGVGNGPTQDCYANCTANVCGDGVKGPSEGCDDGNTDGGDGCSATCSPEGCGNNVTDIGEVCDDGNNDDGDGCSADCQSDETCGNGSVDTAAGEQCDDDGTGNGDGCSSTCQQESGWTCGGEPSTCNTSCGDGIRAGSEGCDDGDNGNGDGCSATCVQEFGYSCVGNTPSVCTSSCGDGQKASNEACDDGDNGNGDGCSSTCTIEFGYGCSGNNPSSCSATCGDGQKANVENCDDGDNSSGDGCSSTCNVEFGYSCSGNNPSNCSSTCGDGLKASNEGCDDDNVANSDGCSSSCTVENGYSCTGTNPSVCCRSGWGGTDCKVPNCSSAPDISFATVMSNLNDNYFCSACHPGLVAPDLTTSGAAHTTMVNVTGACGQSLVVPNNPAGSFLMDKMIYDAVDLCGDSMPQAATASVSFDHLDEVRRWICNGAAND